MGFLASALDRVLERRGFTIGGVPLSSHASAGIFGVSATKAGVDVDAWKALQFAAFWDAVGQISGNTAALPLHVRRHLNPRGHEILRDDDRHIMIHDEANPESTAVSLRQALAADALVHGNGFAEIVKNGRTGRPKAWWHIPADQVTVDRDQRTKRLRYRVPGTRLPLGSEDIVHVPGLAYDGVRGYSVIHMAREAIGRGLASNNFASAFYSNGVWPGLTIIHPGELGPDGRKNLTDSIQEVHGGAPNSFKALVLEEGVQVEKVGMPLKDAQFLESQRFSIEEMARIFNLRPHRLKIEDSARVSNHEADRIEFYSECLRLWLVRIEQELNRKLFSREERRAGLFVEHNVNGLLRGDVKTRFDTYRIGRQWGLYSADDCLEFEGLNPLPDGLGAMYLVPINMANVASMLEEEGVAEPAGAAGGGGGVSGDGDSRPDRPSQSRARMASAMEVVTLDAAERLTSRTINSIQRAARKGNTGLRAIAEDLSKEISFASQLLRPAVTALVAAGGAVIDPVTAARAVGEAHATRLRSDLQAALELGPGELEAHVDLLAQRWRLEWPARIVADVHGKKEEGNA